MKTMVPVAWAVGSAMALAACGNSSLPARPAAARTTSPAKTVAPAANVAAVKAPDKTQTASAPDKAQAVAMPEASIRPEVPTYEARGRRDPFESLEVREGAEGTLVTSAKLTGVVRRSGVPEMALVETSDGIGYILKVGDTLGNGRLAEIGPGVAIFNVAPRSGSNPKRVVLRLASD